MDDFKPLADHLVFPNIERTLAGRMYEQAGSVDESGTQGENERKTARFSAAVVFAWTPHVRSNGRKLNVYQVVCASQRFPRHRMEGDAGLEPRYTFL